MCCLSAEEEVTGWTASDKRFDPICGIMLPADPGNSPVPCEALGRTVTNQVR